MLWENRKAGTAYQSSALYLTASHGFSLTVSFVPEINPLSLKLSPYYLI